MFKLFTLFVSMFFAVNLLAAPDAIGYQKCSAEAQKEMTEKCITGNVQLNAKRCAELAEIIKKCGCKYLETGCDK
ncbi:MAG: hypothetical protein PHT84_06800 [Candidatus Pacebacteria bacterium]|nr:hypothetical protein [Candidatus Paceibacterota bacterium]